MITLYLPIATIVTFFVTKGIETIELLGESLPDGLHGPIAKLNSISTTFLLCEILAYLLLERSEALGVLEDITEKVTRVTKKIVSGTVDTESLADLLERKSSINCLLR